MITGFLAGITFPALLIVVGKQANNRIDPGLNLLWFFLTLTLAVVVHELAHLLAGLALGFRFSSIQVGPFSLRIEHGMLKARFRLEMAAMGYSGMHINRLRRLRRRLLLYIAAGPSANLLSAAAAVLVINNNNALPKPSNPWLAPVMLFAAVSLWLGVLSLIPSGSFLVTDGARIRMLFRSRDRGRRWLSICAVGNLSNNGMRAKNWKRTWLRSAASLRDASVDAFTGNWISYISAHDRKEAHLAATHLERCLELAQILPLSTRDVIAQEAAVFVAWFRHDASLADRWVAQLKKPGLMQHFVRIRLAVAICCAHRDYPGAENAWQAGLAFIETATSGSSRERLKEGWNEWREEILERKTAAVAVSGANIT